MPENQQPGALAPVNYGIIRTYSNAFKSLVRDNQLSQIALNSIPLVTKIDTSDANFQTLLQYNKIAIMPGIENGNFVLCILGLDNWGNVLGAHIKGQLRGEETWPDYQLIKFSQIQQNPDDPQNVYHTFLPQPQ